MKPSSRNQLLVFPILILVGGLIARAGSDNGKVVEGMKVVDKLYSKYGEKPSSAQGQIQTQGNAFLQKNYPELDYIKTATIVAK